MREAAPPEHGSPGPASSRSDPAVDLGPGTALPTEASELLRPGFGSQVDRVTLHTGTPARRIAAQHRMRAFALGSQIGMGSRGYRSGDLESLAVIAHEMAHTRQQMTAGRDAPGTGAEAEADRHAALALVGRPVPRPKRLGGLALQGCPLDLEATYLPADPDEVAFTEANTEFLETSQDLHRARTRYHDAIRGAHPFGMPGLSERRRFDSELAAEGIDQVEYERRERLFVSEFQRYAVAWAAKMLQDTTTVVQAERSRYAAGTDVDELWELLAPARALAPEQAERERLADWAMSADGPPMVTESTLSIFGFRATPRRDPVADARSRIDATRFPIAADPDLDARALAGVDRATFPALLDRICQNRLASIATAAEHLADDHERIWQLDFVVTAAMQAMGLSETSPLRAMITARRARGRASAAEGVGLFAMLFGLLSGFGGIAAAVGVIGAVVSGAYASILRYEDFQFESAIDETAFDRAAALASATDPDLFWVVLEVAMIVPDIVAGRAIVQALTGPTRSLLRSTRAGNAAEISRASEGVTQAANTAARSTGDAVSQDVAEDLAGAVISKAPGAAAQGAVVEGASQALVGQVRARGLGDVEVAGFLPFRGGVRQAVLGLTDTGLRWVSGVSALSPTFRAGVETLLEAAGESATRQILEYVAALRPQTQRRYISMLRQVGESGMTATELRSAMGTHGPTATGQSRLRRLNSDLDTQRTATLERRAGEVPGPGEIDSPLRGTPAYPDAVRRRGTLARELDGARAGWSGADEAAFRGLPGPTSGDAWHINSQSGRLEYRRNGLAMHVTTEAMTGAHRLPAPEAGYRYQRAPDLTPPYRIQADPTATGSPSRPQRELYETPEGQWAFRDTGGRLLSSQRLGRSLEAAHTVRPPKHQAHHLNPSEVVRDHELFKIARDLPLPHRYDGDRAANGIFLPDSPGARTAHPPSNGLPLHNTSHRRYNRLASEAADEGLSALKLQVAPGLTDPEAIKAALAAHPEAVAAAVSRVEQRMRTIVQNWVTDHGSQLQ